MNDQVRNFREPVLSGSRTPVRADQKSRRIVRLSQLRKLRECEQVAAVCYRVRGGSIEFLLVQTRGSGRWTFPKGSAEPGLTHAQAAALEASEEAGVHGRIEEVPFVRYARRKRGMKHGAGSDAGKLTVSAHLCEVRRLSPARESGRNRTWFAARDASQRLREGRRSDDGTEFARVIARAVERIQQLNADYEVKAVRLSLDPVKKDALQKVQFDFGEANGRAGSFTPFVRRQLDEMRQSAMPAIDVPRREVVACEVLEFGSARFSVGKKPKTLGIGTKSC